MTTLKETLAEKTQRLRWWILSVLCLSLLIVMLGNTALNMALPTLSRQLNASNSQLQWMVDAYSLVFAGFLFLAGDIGDRFGRKGILQVGLFLFGGASLYAAIGVNTANQLIATRAVMGLAGAMIMPATLSILTNVFSKEERPRAVGLWAGISGAGVALGPLLSGYLLEHGSWHNVFLINIPVIILALISGFILIPHTKDANETGFDFAGALLSVVSIVSVVYAIIQAPTAGWLSGQTLGVLALGVAAAAAFVRWELHVKYPMLDVRLFKIPAFGIGSLVLTLVFFSLMGMFFNMSQLMQLVYGYTPLQSAVRLLPVSLGLMIAAPLSPRLVERFGKRLVVSTGMLVVAAGVIMLSTVGTEPNMVHLIFSVVVAAFGMGMAMSPTTDLLMSAVPRTRAGMGSAMNDTTRELGGSLGVAIMGSLLASQYASKITSIVSNLPQAARSAAESSLAGALAVSNAVGGSAGAQLASDAKSAWMHGFTTSLLIGAAIIAVSSLIAFFFLPNKAEA